MTISTASCSLLLLEVSLLWGPVLSERTTSIDDSSGWQGCEEASSEPLSLALFGLTGDGKSTTCSWLSAKEAGCKVGHGLESETNQISIVTSPWFGESACGPLTMIDTPGLSDTKERDDLQWTSTVAELKKRLMNLDAVVLVANFAQTRMREERRRMLEVLRRSFGTELWGHLAVLFTHFSWQTDKNIGGSTPEELQTTAQAWREYFKNMELENRVQGREMWVGHKKKLMMATIDSIPFFGVDYSPRTPLAPASQVNDDMRDIMGLNELSRMRLWMNKTRKEKGPMDLKDVQPRMGPSEVRARQKWQCKYTQRCLLDVAGDSLSAHDHLRVFPTSVFCGREVKDHMFASNQEQVTMDSQESALKATQVTLPVEYMTRRADKGTGEQRSFDLGIAQLPGKYRICYCEFGNCDHASRFMQDAGVLEIYRPSCGPIVCPENAAGVSISGGEPISCMLEDMPTVDFPRTVRFACEPDYLTTQNGHFFHGSCTIDGQLMIDNAPGKDHAESCQWAPNVDAALLFSGQTVFTHTGRQFKCCVSTLPDNAPIIQEIFTNNEDNKKKLPKSSRKVPCLKPTGCGCMFGDTWHSYDKNHKKLTEPSCIMQVTKLAKAVGMSPMEVITSIATAPTLNMEDTEPILNTENIS